MNKKSIIVVLCWIISLNSWAQLNLVPNYSFENFSSCPTVGPGEINKSIPWFQPNLAGESSDFYHNCSGYVPYNVTYQYPRTGNGYAGINLYHDTASFWKDYDREYIEVGLSNALVENKKYCISYFVNKANRSGFALKQIQAVLTIDSLLYFDANWNYITGVTPIVESSIYVSDTLNWTRVSAIIVANGGEKFLTLGNFEPGDSVDYQMGWWPYNAPDNTLGYYLFDDVSVYELPDYNAGVDDTICPFHNIVIGPQTSRSDVQYSWFPTTGLSDPNVANPIASPLIDMTYILTVTDTNQWACNSVLTDTVNIYVDGCLGIHETQNEILYDLYPNPASDFISIVFYDQSKQGLSLEISDITGKIIYSKLIQGEKEKINTLGWPRGNYFIRVLDENKIIGQKYFTLQ